MKTFIIIAIALILPTSLFGQEVTCFTLSSTSSSVEKLFYALYNGKTTFDTKIQNDVVFTQYPLLYIFIQTTETDVVSKKKEKLTSAKKIIYCYDRVTKYVETANTSYSPGTKYEYDAIKNKIECIFYIWSLST